MSYLLTILISFILGAVVGYLSLRNNPKVKKFLDEQADRYDD